jgi:hypothetical protein
VIITAGKFRLVVFVSKVQLFYKQVSEQARRGREERKWVIPLTCCVG